MNTHPIKCKCGTVRGELQGKGLDNRIICYCTDCRAYVRFLGRDADVLDAQGGVEIVQVAQPRVKFLQGTDRLEAVRLSEKGMIRWYASCCNTPIGNTMANPKVSFIGLIHSALDSDRMNQDFGATVAKLNTTTALGDPKPAQSGLPGTIARFMWMIVTTRLSGRYKDSELFNQAGAPRVKPKLLAPEELAHLKNLG
jgi:hypothetical protein